MNRRTFLGAIGQGIGVAVASRLMHTRTARAAPAGRGTLVMAPSFVIRSLDPGHVLEPVAEMVCHAAYDSLVTFEGEDLQTPKPSLATGWKVSSDGKTYTFALRPNVKFASGTPMTSADVKWSFDRIINLKANPTFFLDGVEEVLAPDQQTVVLRMKAPQPSIVPILSSPSLGILDSKLVADHGGESGPDAKTKDEAEAYLNGHSAGTGAFSIEGYTPNQEVILVRNPRHWRGPAAMERIVLRNIPEASTQALQLARGDLDIATGLGRDNAQTLRRVSSISVQSSRVATSFVFMVNEDPQLSGQLSNPKVIQAMRYALDYEGLLTIAGPGAVRMAGVIPNTLPGSLDPREAVRTDRDKARALLREAGLATIKGTLMYSSDVTAYGIQYSLLAQKIQADLATVGITIDLNGLPGTVSLQNYRDGKAPALVGGYAADYPDASDFLVYLPGRLVGKRMRWPANASPTAQELAQWGDEAEAEGDLRKRMALLQKVQRRLLEIGPYAPLFQPALPWAHRADLRGVTFHSVWGVDFYAVRRV
jgi:peptide/nickel transport system substrate-binding protein